MTSLRLAPLNRRYAWDASLATIWAALERCTWASGSAITAEPWSGEPRYAELDMLYEAARACRAAETPDEFGAALATLWAAIDRCDRVSGKGTDGAIPFPTVNREP